MTTPASNTPTSEGQGGTGGGETPPGVTPSTTDRDAGTDTSGGGGSRATEPASPAATQPDTTSGGVLGGVGATGNTDDHTRDPQPVGDTTTYGGIGGTANPAYRAPLDNPPAENVETSNRAGTLAVDPASPDAALVGDASGINPNAVAPDDNALPSGYAQTGTKDTGGYGSPALTTVPAGGTPLAPTSVTASAVTGRSAVHVGFTAPTNAAAANVLGYVVENDKGGTMRVGKNKTSNIEFEQGLVPGDSYKFSVYAVTATGSGPRSAWSSAVTIPKNSNLQPDTERDYGI